MKRLFCLLLLVALAIFVAAEKVTIIANAIKGGKNTQVVDWFEKFIPSIEKELNIQVELIQTGIKDEDFKARIVLDIKGGGGADILWIDGFWVPEFVEAGYLRPIDDILESIPAWKYYYDSMKAMGSYKGKTYLVPASTDVRMIYYNKELFKKAGIPIPWQPKSWEDIIKTARIIKEKLPGVTPLQINAGTEMGEATTMQGFFMVLLGAGGNLYDWESGKWITNSSALRDTLAFYKQIYVDEKLGDAQLQVSPGAREKSFELFRQEKIAMYVEGTWMFTSVLNPNNASWGFPDRDERIGWAAMPGRGKPGDPEFVSISGGTGFAVNPNTKNPKLVAEVLKRILYIEPQLTYFELKPFVSPRSDLADSCWTINRDKFIAETSRALVKYTTFRPAFPVYPEISFQAQLLTERVVTKQMTIDQALKEFAAEVTRIVGKENVTEKP
ncbi:extracellular solute-binding protein [Pseudothermotoga sp. U03pept]|uniref:extracellular solute-binding protein n=1 Tax=Pseudothermotoga sp. U03pept TaxID=3447012 RepID=UPI003F0A9734